MRLIQRQVTHLLLLFAVLIGAAGTAQAATAPPPAGSIIYWNPGTSTDGGGIGNWTVNQDGTASVTNLPVTTLNGYVLSFSGSGSGNNNDCVFGASISCASLLSTASYTGKISITTGVTLTVQGVFDIGTAQQLVIEIAASLVINDIQRGTNTSINRIMVQLQLNSVSAVTGASGISNQSAYALQIAGAISGDGVAAVPLTLGTTNSSAVTTLSGASSLSAGVSVIDSAGQGSTGIVRVSGTIPSAVALSEGARLQVDGQVGAVGVVSSETGTAVLFGRGRVGAVTFSRSVGGSLSQAIVTGGNGRISPVDDTGAPTQLRCQSIKIDHQVYLKAATAKFVVSALTGAGTGYSRLASDGAVIIGGNGYLDVDLIEGAAIELGTATLPVRLSGIITHPAGQRSGWFVPANVSATTSLARSVSTLRASVAINNGSVEVVPDYRSTGIDLVLMDSSTLPVASFAPATSTVFAGQSQAALGVVTLSSAPTTTVVLTYTDDVGAPNTTATATASDLPSFNVGTTRLLVFQPGETAKSITTAIATDEVTTVPKTFTLTLGSVASGAVIGQITTSTITIIPGSAALSGTADGTSIGNGLVLGSVALGQPITVVLTGGQPPYVGTGTSLNFFAGPLTANGLNPPTQTFTVASTQAGSRSFTFADSKATPTQLGPVTFISVSATPTSVTPPALPISLAPTTTYVPLAGATSEGLSSLLGAIAGVPAIDVAAYSWDANAQAYAKLPAQPAGGTTITHGIFVATRVGLSFDLSGTPQPMYNEIPLKPGWNFIGVPLVANGSVPEASHLWSQFVLFPTGTAVSSYDGAERDMLIGTGAYFWNGSAYSVVTTLATGTGYWIKNNGSNPLVLVRFPTATSGPQTRAAGGSQATTGLVRYLGAVTGGMASRSSGTIVDRGSPPNPPGSSSAEGAKGNACGSGSGIAAFIMLLLAGACHLLLVRRR